VRLAIVHHHLHPGGVTRIIEHAVSALRAHDVEIVILSGVAPQRGWDVPLRVVDALAYEEQRAAASPAQLATDLQAAVRDALGSLPDLWHVHNHALGKNLILPGALRVLAAGGQRLLLQLHDFAEDGRPLNYRRLRRVVGEGDGARLVRCLYPQAGQVHYAVLNGRDLKLLGAAGISPSRLHALANPVSLQAAASDAEPVRAAQGRLWLYPTRAIRRKNLGEFLLWAALAEPGDRFATTLGPNNPAERPRYERWRELAAELDLPVSFELGTDAALRFEDLLSCAHAMVTTSIAEGFGLAFLEPWLVGRAVTGRNLDEITMEFSDAGVSLPQLYGRLDVPLEWIGQPVLQAKAQAGLQRCWDAYGRRLRSDDLSRTLAAWIDDGRVDFGRLDEALQEQLIRRVNGSVEARGQLRPPRLPDPGEGSEDIDENRAAILANFSREQYGVRLMDIYQQLMDSSVEPLDSLPGEAVLDQFLAPERLYLLRS
jgi:glycosyltransferase involved in cell wall biosynthesis